MSKTLEGKTYIVTGASRGIGLAAAKALGKRGARVALFGRDADALARGAKDVGNDSLPVVVDLEDRDALIAAIDHAAEAMGGLDGIINNAGLSLFNRVEALQPENVNKQLNVNFLAQAYGCQAAIPHLRRRGGGRIVNVSSVTVRHPDEFAFISIYSATKAAIERFTIDLRQEVKNDNISVTLFSPGSTSTTFGSGQDPVIMGEAFEEWLRRAEMYDGTLSAEIVGETLVRCLELPDGVNIDFIELSPNKPTPRRETLENYAERSNNP
jgi:NAD(P)-dependent dehydrogenase (short-subunit alcohol dehydrogenase family)